MIQEQTLREKAMPINPCVDFAFKKIFGVIENKDILIHFINSVIKKKIPIKRIHLCNPFNDKEHIRDKLSVLDIKALDEEGELYNIEMQITRQAFFGKLWCRESETNTVKNILVFGVALLTVMGCAGRPRGLPEIVQSTAEQYLMAWQEGNWVELYRLEEKNPSEQPVLHGALTDHLESYMINEVRYSDSAAACVITLHWATDWGVHTETGELYLERSGARWRIAGFRSY